MRVRRVTRWRVGGGESNGRERRQAEGDSIKDQARRCQWVRIRSSSGTSWDSGHGEDRVLEDEITPGISRANTKGGPEAKMVMHAGGEAVIRQAARIIDPTGEDRVGEAKEDTKVANKIRIKYDMTIRPVGRQSARAAERASTQAKGFGPVVETARGALIDSH